MPSIRERDAHRLLKHEPEIKCTAAGKRVGFIGLGLMGSGTASNIARKHGPAERLRRRPGGGGKAGRQRRVGKATPKDWAARRTWSCHRCRTRRSASRWCLARTAWRRAWRAARRWWGCPPTASRRCATSKRASGRGHRLRRLPRRQGAPGGRGGRPGAVASGERETCKALEWLLSMIGSRIYYCGPLAPARRSSRQHLLSCGYGALIAEAYAMAKEAGADWTSSAKRCRRRRPTAAAAERSLPRRSRATSGRIPPLGGAQDYRLIVAMAQSLGTSSRAAEAVLDYYERAAVVGHSDKHFGALALVTNPELASK